LATINAVDFFYSCDGHLKDPGVATQIEPSPEAPKPEDRKVSDEEIKRVKEEWEEQQRKKKEKEKAEKDKGKEKEKDDKEDSKSPAPKSPPPPAPIPVPGSAAKPTHQKFTLHRDVWAMRLGEHKKKRQTAAAKEIAPKLPGAPRGTPLP